MGREQMKRVEQMYSDWRYRFRVEAPINRDAQVLILTRARFKDDWEQQVLTTNGWRGYQGYEALPSDLPEMTALDIIRDKTAVSDLMKQVEALVQGMDGGLAPAEIP